MNIARILIATFLIEHLWRLLFKICCKCFSSQTQLSFSVYQLYFFFNSVLCALIEKKCITFPCTRPFFFIKISDIFHWKLNDEMIEYLGWKHGLTLSWQRSLSYRNQFIDLVCKSIDWLLYYRDLYCERIKLLKHWYDTKNVYDTIQRTFMMRHKERLWHDTKNVYDTTQRTLFDRWVNKWKLLSCG